MKTLKMKNLEKPMKLKIGSVIELEKQHRQAGKPEYAKVVDTEDARDGVCSVCVLGSKTQCWEVFSCATPEESTLLMFCNKEGEIQ